MDGDNDWFVSYSRRIYITCRRQKLANSVQSGALQRVTAAVRYGKLSISPNSIRAVYFIRDLENVRLDEPDITPFYRACDLNNVPLATNLVGAVALTHWLGRHLERVGAAPSLDLVEAE